MKTLSAPITGMLLSALAFLFFTGFDTASKYLAGSYSVFQIMSVEFVTAGLLIWLYAQAKVWTGAGPSGLHTNRPNLHLLRSGFQIAGQSLAFMAIPHLSLAEFYVIVFCMPAVTVLKAGWFLKERAAAHVWPVIALNFFGVLIALRPDQGVNWWAGVALAGVVLLSASQVVLRRMAASETAEMPAIATTVALAFAAAAVTPFVYRPMALSDFALMVLGGVLFAPAQMLLVSAFRMAPVALATPPQFLQLAYGALAGYAVFGDVPSVAVCIGGGTVIAANAGLIYAEKRAPQQLAPKEREAFPAS
jgi:drug/metabolite transporter (DMT)-like permease